VASRRFIITAAALAVGALSIVQIAAKRPAPAPDRYLLAPGSVWDSVFTTAQAARGEVTFRASCVNCHGDSLAGIDDAPPLTGSAFAANWNGNTLAKLTNRIANDMPSDNPGSLTRPQAVDIVAFMLRYNGFPAGSVELTQAADTLAMITFAPKP
jgi:mono/diheme cytochrome c family protein